MAWGWWSSAPAAATAPSARAPTSSSPSWFWGWWPSSPEQKRKAQFCHSEFPPLWESWVTGFTEFGFTGSATAPPFPTSTQQPSPPGTATSPAHDLPKGVLPAAERLVAIGDLHGDMRKAWRAFRLAGLIDERGRWSGGSTVCVQVGDILDRGDQELQIFYMLERLQLEAAQAGGALYVLNGNHETMNVASNHRYATPGAAVELRRWQQWQALAQRLRDQCTSCSAGAVRGPPPAPPRAPAQGPPGGQHQQQPQQPQQQLSASHAAAALHFERTGAMQPGAHITRRFMANHPISLQVGSNLFAHGGVLPEHVEYGLERINKETQTWLLEGSALKAPAFLRGSTAIVWARDYSAEDEARCDCNKLQQVLQSIPGAKRMVVGHTIQSQGVNSACNGAVVRVDVGLSRGCGDGKPQVLEILNDTRVRRLQEGQAPEELGQLQRGGGGQQEPGGRAGAGSGAGAGAGGAAGRSWWGAQSQLRGLLDGAQRAA